MLGLSARSPLVLPWATLVLAGRFVLPLALWFTVGELLRFGVLQGGYRLSEVKGLAANVAPLLTVSLLVMITLGVTVAMVHCVREGLAVVHAREDDGELTPWAVGNDERVSGAMSRAVLPFVIFYLAWGMQSEDAKEFAATAQSEGFAEGGLQGHIEGLGMLLELERHLALAIGLTVGFLALKLLAEWLLQDRLPTSGGAVLAFFEVNFALFGIFTIDELRKAAGDWITGREAWRALADATGPLLDLWPPFRYAVLGGLLWLVIAGVVLGLDAGDERVVLGSGRAARRFTREAGIERHNSPREILTRGIRDLVVPAWYGLRLVRRSGVVPFGAFCALFMGLYVAEDLVKRQVFELIGAHPLEWWLPRQGMVGFGTGMVFEILRICLLAATFNLVMARVNARNAAKAVGPSAGAAPAAAPQGPRSSPWSGAARP
ncbi:hypothetical protein [Spirillospora sp. NPDC029432]|uniref:hypothetical protein n=1 Tax=Spirillospora sp. NPDC029432 TaxID=3154599 RepID=UPI003454FBB8